MNRASEQLSSPLPMYRPYCAVANLPVKTAVPVPVSAQACEMLVDDDYYWPGDRRKYEG